MIVDEDLYFCKDGDVPGLPEDFTLPAAEEKEESKKPSERKGLEGVDILSAIG